MTLLFTEGRKPEVFDAVTFATQTPSQTASVDASLPAATSEHSTSTHRAFFSRHFAKIAISAGAVVGVLLFAAIVAVVVVVLRRGPDARVRSDSDKKFLVTSYTLA